MKTSLFYLPIVGNRAEIESGMAGTRGELYDRMLAEISEQAVLADELGYDSISFTEHHFHIEGFELSIRWCAEEGVTAIPPPLHPSLERHLFELYAEASGRAIGEGVGVLRDVIVADSDEEAQRLWSNSAAFVGAAWFEPFGFSRGLVDPATGERPDLFREGLALVGSADTVTRQLERLLDRLPAKWLFAWQYNSCIPHADLMRSIESFYSKVLPRVAEP